MRFSNVLAGALALGMALGARSAAASYPAGVWVKVQKVVLEPNATSPTKIQVHGAAMLYDKSTGTSYGGYSEPALGYLYYGCPSGQDKTCASEWADVEKNIAAGADVCIGLGDQSMPTGSLRSPNATPTSADAYPIAMGVLSGYTPCKVLESFLLGQPDGGSGGAGGTGGAGTGGAGTGGVSSGGSPSSGGAAGSPSSGGAAGSPSTGGASSGGAASGGASSGGASSGGKAGASDGSEDDGGCSISAGAGSSLPSWALAALGAAVALGRRRRS